MRVRSFLASPDLAALVLRLSFGATMLVAHGWGKLTGLPEGMDKFPDPLGVGSSVSMLLTVFAEAICGAAVAVGFKTRYAALPLIITMLVAALIVHGDDPWRKKELAFLYAFGYAAIAVLGSGRYSVDRLLGKK